MDGGSFRDLDGHVIKVMWMDVKAETGLTREEVIAKSA
jgi:hypothetical protein